MQEPIKLKY